MTPPAEPILEVGQQVPSLLSAALRMGGAVLLMAALAAAWMVWQRRRRPAGRRLEVLDRAFLARGASVALLRVENRHVLVGVSNEGVRLIRDIDAAPDADRFRDAMADADRESSQ